MWRFFPSINPEQQPLVRQQISPAEQQMVDDWRKKAEKVNRVMDGCLTGGAVASALWTYGPHGVVDQNGTSLDLLPPCGGIVAGSLGELCPTIKFRR